jgi:hypothetical protein
MMSCRTITGDKAHWFRGAASLYVQRFFSPEVQLDSPRCIGRSSQIIWFLKTLEKKELD